VAHYEGRLDEYRKDKERRRGGFGGFDNLKTIDSQPVGRSGALTAEEQMKMDQIRRKETEQNEILDQINDNLEHLDWKARKLNDAIEDSMGIVDEVTAKSAQIDGKVGSLRADVEEANKKSKKKKKKNKNVTKAQLAAHAAGAMLR